MAYLNQVEMFECQSCAAQTTRGFLEAAPDFHEHWLLGTQATCVDCGKLSEFKQVENDHIETHD